MISSCRRITCLEPAIRRCVATVANEKINYYCCTLPVQQYEHKSTSKEPRKTGVEQYLLVYLVPPCTIYLMTCGTSDTMYSLLYLYVPLYYTWYKPVLRLENDSATATSSCDQNRTPLFIYTCRRRQRTFGEEHSNELCGINADLCSQPRVVVLLVHRTRA